MVTIDTISPACTRQGNSTGVRKGVLSPFRRLGQRLRLWWRVRKTRVHLSDLTEDQLRDVGLSPEMAEREIRKSRLLLVERCFQPPM